MSNTVKIQLKTPINYWGGKQQLLPKILPIIPEHSVYTESFFGGGALFFAKQPVKVEAINDINGQVVNFYKVAKTQFKSLKTEIDCTLFSEQQFKEAKAIYSSCEQSNQNNVLKAWALFVLSQQAFLNMLDNSWKFSHDRNLASTFHNKKEMFDNRYVKRLEHTQIFCRDANRMLKNMDCPEAFHFIDPPYINTDMGHYKGYTIEDFETLLNTCSSLKGKFLLCSFPSDILNEYTQKYGWYQTRIEMYSAAKGGNNSQDNKKIEVFTTNFPVSEGKILSLISEENKPHMAA